MLVDNRMGDAGARVVIEDFLEGEEASFIVMVDGRNILPLASSQDHKRLADGDQGPNTGGMGAYSPAPVITPEVHARVMREIIRPTVEAMAAEGTPYTGFLYAGLMIDAAGKPRTLEFNCRLGDPETQPIMMRIRGDFARVIEHAIDVELDKIEVEWDRRCALGVVLAAAGYPDDPRRGDTIRGLPAQGNAFGDDCMVFHAGTTEQGGETVSAGGRVLCVTALGDSVRAAQSRAYRVIETVGFDGMQLRRDIGHRAIGRSSRS
jgi:phosphoribosylamine--glycine ligase